MSEFNQDELEAPSWLDKSYFEDILRKYEKDNSISITDLRITPGSGKGDHYGSIMFRAAIVYDTSETKGNSLSLIVKTMPEVEGHKKDMFADTYIFETEIAMYSKTIPQFEAQLRKVGDNTILGAKCYYYSLEPRKIIVFEDLVVKGYETPRNRPTSMAEVKGALLKLAKWHAVSYKLAAEGDTSITEYKECWMNFKDLEQTMPFLGSAIENLIIKADSIAELKQYVPHLRAVQKDIIKGSIASFNSFREKGSQGIFTLNHGDFHSRNMMFRTNDKGEHQEVMLVDFQVCYFGPAVLDLLCSIYSVCSPDLRKNHRDEIIYYYCTTFIDTLKQLKFEGEYPKISDFYIDIIRNKYWELFLVSCLSFVYAGAKGDMEMGDLMTSEETRKNVCEDEDYINELKLLLPTLLHRGYLEGK